MAVMQITIDNGDKDPGYTVLAEPVTANFAIGPAFIVDSSAEDQLATLEHRSNSWHLIHIPTSRVFCDFTAETTDGKPKYFDLDKLRAFAAWLEDGSDWSVTDPAEIPKPETNDQKILFTIFSLDPDAWPMPPAAAEQGPDLGELLKLLTAAGAGPDTQIDVVGVDGVTPGDDADESINEGAI